MKWEELHYTVIKNITKKMHSINHQEQFLCETFKYIWLNIEDI